MQAGLERPQTLYIWFRGRSKLLHRLRDSAIGQRRRSAFRRYQEGTFAVRVHEAIKVDAKKGGKIINSVGDKDGDAWGKPADWVDYHGPIGNNTVGIAILCHPSTFHYPNRWHVRTYGLFAANPFGVSHFLGNKEMTDGTRIKKGEETALPLSRDHPQRRRESSQDRRAVQELRGAEV